jgi:MFS family permease
MTVWVYAPSNLWLWIFGHAWSFGFLGFWGPSTTLTAEVFPTRIRGVANGVVWFIGFFVGFVLWPFATVAATAGDGILHAGFLDDTYLHGRHGRGSLVYRPRARRQGAQRDRRLSAQSGHLFAADKV